MPTPRTIYHCKQHDAYYTAVVHGRQDGTQMLCVCSPVDAEEWMAEKRTRDRASRRPAAAR